MKYDYDQHGQGYNGHRQTDPRIAAFVHEAVGDAGVLLNVGAGAGSYEPTDKYVLAIEPSAAMRAQRRGTRPPAIISDALSIPLDDKSVDASMAILTVHHWPDMTKGLSELRRVTSKRIVIMTFDPDALDDFWNARYFPEVIAIEKRRYPSIDFLVRTLGNHCTIQAIPVPFDCVDGFQEAFYGRPEAFLDPAVRQAQSAWGFLPKGEEEPIVARLAKDLETGVWDERYGHFRTQANFTCALRLVIAEL